MKPFRPLLPPAVLFALLLGSPAVATADAFSEFRIPDHTWQSATAGFNVSGGGARSTTSLQPGESNSASAYGYTRLNLVRFRDSDRVQLGWEGAATGSGSAGRDQAYGRSYYDPPGRGFELDSRAQSFDQSLSLSNEGRFYPGESPFGFTWSASAFAGWEQSWARSRETDQVPGSPYDRYEYSHSGQEHDYRYNALARLGFGYGRVRDVTPVEDVHVLEERLREAGALARPLSPAARKALAGLLVVSPRLSYAHERPARYLWREIERVLVDDGALAGGHLDAYALNRAMERVSQRPTRARGHFVGVTLGLDHQHSILRSDEEYGTASYAGDSLVYRSEVTSPHRTTTATDEAMAGLAAEWHQPIGWAWQVDASAAASVPVRPGEKGLSASARLILSWHIADRWLASGTLDQQRYYIELGERDDSVPRDNWNVAVLASLNYYLEDHTTLFANFTDTQRRTRQSDDAFPIMLVYFQESARFSAGVTYRFFGRVSAPGLFEAMTPI